ncbi:MAG: FAD-dependent oxidoreductase, partial [Clostridiales bacterium]|nr:FAD-dependent oxidoreductase [Clostridiales bacterium]
MLKKLSGPVAILLTVALILGAVQLNGTYFIKRSVPGPIINGVEGYHVIVAGGDPEGVSAALSAARNGLRVLLVCEQEALGGLMTLGMLNFIDMNYFEQPGVISGSRVLLTQGIFGAFYGALGNAFDVGEAKAWFLTQVHREPNIDLLLNVKIVAPIMEGNAVCGLTVLQDGEERDYYSLRLIDATVDADVAAMAGVPYTVGGEDFGKNEKQGVTLVFCLSGVDWQGIRDYVNYEKNENNNMEVGITNEAAWGYGPEALLYVPQNPRMRLRGPNIARQKNGDVLINALIIFGVDALDERSKQQAMEEAEAELAYIVGFMRENFRGFENAILEYTATQLYVRETRHIIGEYRLTIDDVLENRDHWDRIAHGSYPVDIQPTSPASYGTVVGNPDIYSIPFRSLVPLLVENLLVVGRSASYDSLPHGSARVIPVGMVTGEAAGVAA